jgi:PAS domain S-box-containing protein
MTRAPRSFAAWLSPFDVRGKTPIAAVVVSLVVLVVCSGLALSTDQQEADSGGARRIALLLPLCLLAALALAAGIVILLRRHVAQLVQPLAAGLARLAAGDWTAPLEASPIDPDGQIAASVNEMVRRCREAALAQESGRQLRDAEECFRLAFTEAPAGMAFVDLQGRFLRVNRALCEIVGYSAEELTAATFQSITHPSDLEADEELTQRLARGEVSNYQLDERYVRKNGQIIDVRLKAALVRSADGRPLHFITQVEDVTARNRVQRERDESLHRLRMVLTHTPVAIAITDDGHHWQANACAEELFGQDMEDFTTNRWLGSICDADGAPLPSGQLPPVTAVRGVHSHDVEMRICRPDGQSVAVLVNAAPLRVTTGGGRGGAVVAFEDISALKELDRLRAEWNAMVAHDLRQPLNGISLQVQLMAQNAKHEPALLERIDRIQRSTRRLSRMVQDLLDLSRIEARQFQLDRTPIDLADIVRSSTKASASDAPDRPFDVRIGPDLEPVVADADRIAQVMDNLLSNAIKYGTPGTPIVVEVRRVQDRVSVGITNEGPGIPADKRALLFQRFQRGGLPGALRKQSVGLGLFITRSLVQAHGGSVDVESTPGQRTTFRFSLPLVARAHAAAESVATS